MTSGSNGFGSASQAKQATACEEEAMNASALARRVAVIIAAAAFCVAVAGCVSDAEAAAPRASKKSITPARYYGGPKSPMWRSQ